MLSFLKMAAEYRAFIREFNRASHTVRESPVNDVIGREHVSVLPNTSSIVFYESNRTKVILINNFCHEHIHNCKVSKSVTNC